MTDAAQPSKDRLLEDFGRALLSDPRLAAGGWRAVSVIITVQPGVQYREYFLYPEGDAPGEAWRPRSSGALSDTARNLHKVMAAETDKSWQQMLYQVWMPGPDFAATFEYERADRWARTSFSLEGIGALAAAVDPAAGRG